jgi:DNA polymerase-4
LIQEEVYATTGLTGSAGVAPNKLLAKIASDMRKPKGMTVVLPDQAHAFMQNLPLRKIHGIGPVTEKRLAEVGLSNCRDVWRYSLAELAAKIGKLAEWLYDGSRGIDDRPVETDWIRKSLGREETFAFDILDVEALRAELATIAKVLIADLLEEGVKGRTVTLKVRYADFTRITRSHSLPVAVNDLTTVYDVARGLLARTEAGRRKIRLLGVSLSNLDGQSLLEG